MSSTTATQSQRERTAAERRTSKRAAVPTVLQMEVTECGAASLGMVLAHFGRWVPLRELREVCGASRDGTTAGDILQAARSFGLDGRGSYVTAGNLKHRTFPLVLFWKQNHFVVLEYIDDKFAWLNDPASGPCKIPFDEFERDYSKICLTLTPTDDFTPSGRAPSEWSSLLRRARPAMAHVAAIVVLGLLATVPGLAMAAIVKLYVDLFLIGGDRSTAWTLVTALGGVLALQAGIAWFQTRVLIRVAIALTGAESAKFVRKALRLPEGFFMSRSVSDLSQRVQYNQEVVSLLTGRLAMVAVGMIVVCIYAIAMLFVDPFLALIVVAFAVANLLVMRTALRRAENSSRLLVERQARLHQTTMYGAFTLEDIKAAGLESDFYARWEGLAVGVADIRQEVAIRSEVGTALPGLLISLSSIAILVVGASQVIGGALAIGSLVAFQSLASSFNSPINEFVSFSWMVQRAKNLTRRLDDVLDEPVQPHTSSDRADEALPKQKLNGALELRNVTFGYKRTTAPLIEQLDLSIPPGARVAVVGTSGSGKSTLVRLAAGLHQPWSGEVLLDGRPRGEHNEAVLTQSIAMVDQRISLFSGTVRDNVTFWDASIGDHDLVQACTDAQIHDAIAGRAGGYDSIVADGGSNWSGGQRQRITIARALVRNPTLLLLDEATSALDADTEAAVEAALRRRGCTALVVAHRLSTIRDADLVIVMDQGRIAQAGRHDDLILQDGHYAELVQQ